jgi:penicillin-binding protein 1C
MQLARLVRGNPPRTLGEKAVEAALALRIECSYSKTQILALYAANAPYGGNVVGMEAAARRYFGRAPDTLSWAEAATLAVLPNDPALINPGRGRAELQRKRDAVLARLRRRGRLDEMDYRLALREPLPGAPQPLPRLAPQLLDTLAAQDPDRSQFDTTIDRPLQLAVSRVVQARADAYSAQGIYNAAALVIDNATMQVRAYAGNSADPLEAGRAPERGYAVDVIQRPRSTGSVLKPFLFAAMVQDGAILPDSLVPDVPMHFAGFKPENFDHGFRGAVRARAALAQSLNVPAVHLLREYGVARFYDLLRHLGMSSLSRQPDGYGLTLVLGGAEGKLWDIAGMYANLARIAGSNAPRGGAHYASLSLLRDRPSAPQRPAELGAGAAWLTLDALQEVSRPELDQYWKNFSSTRKLAWKTGTSYGLRDGWAVGVTPRYTVAVWVGNASGEGRAGLTGAGMAAPILFDILNRLDDGGWFAVPGADLHEIPVCRDDGYLPSNGCDTQRVRAPLEAHFQAVSTHHLVVHLDPARRWQVDSRCEPVAGMVHQTWFVLPPAQEYFYRMRDAAYRGLPPWRADCRAAEEGARRPFEIVYPEAGTVVYIPTDLGGKRSRVVFEAADRERDAVLHWHLDDQYLGSTSSFHKLPLDIAPGEHRLTVVDAAGNRQTRQFTVLGKDDDGPGTVAAAAP